MVSGRGSWGVREDPRCYSHSSWGWEGAPISLEDCGGQGGFELRLVSGLGERACGGPMWNEVGALDTREPLCWRSPHYLMEPLLQQFHETGPPASVF